MSSTGMSMLDQVDLGRQVRSSVTLSEGKDTSITKSENNSNSKRTKIGRENNEAVILF